MIGSTSEGATAGDVSGSDWATSEDGTVVAEGEDGSWGFGWGFESSCGGGSEEVVGAASVLLMRDGWDVGRDVGPLFQGGSE